MSALLSSVRWTASASDSSSTGRLSGAGDASVVGVGLGEGAGAWAKAGAAEARSRANAARLTRIILTRPPTVRATFFVRAAAPTTMGAACAGTTGAIGRWRTTDYSATRRGRLRTRPSHE